VDDDPLIRSLFSRLLTEYLSACEVHVAEDGVVAKERVSRVRPALILLDLVMPRLSGAEFCQWLRSGEFADTKVLLLSGTAGEGLAERALAAGADAWLPKPMSMDLLLRTVRGLLGD
jgi:two-component system alkaline phosphatase synthesis response regulator PhoP